MTSQTIGFLIFSFFVMINFSETFENEQSKNR